MERLVLALSLSMSLVVAMPARAQTAPAAAPPDDLALGEREDRMTVPVTVAGAGPFPFVIDTGAQRSVISRQLAARLGLPAGARVRLTAMSGTSDVDTVIVPSLSVAPVSRGIAAGRVEAPALDAGDLGALGLLGIDTLQGQSVSIDFDRGRMSVAPARRRASARSGATDEIVIRARSSFGQLVVTDATINGRQVRVVLDTGTAVSLGNDALRRMLARRRGGGSGGRGEAQAVLTSVTGGVVIATYAAVPQMTLGRATVRGLVVAFAEVAPFRAFGIAKRPAILLGMDVLKLFRRVEIDFANRELRLAMPR